MRMDVQNVWEASSVLVPLKYPAPINRASLEGYVLRRSRVDCSEGYFLRDPEYRLCLRNRALLDCVGSASIAPCYISEKSGCV